AREGSDRQEALILGEVLDMDADADLVLDAEHRSAEEDVAAEPALRGAEAARLRPVERETAADELVDLDGDVEGPLGETLEAGGALGLGRDEAGEFELGEERQSVRLAVARRADADRRADIGEEAIFLRPVVLGDRTRIGEGTEEELEEAALEDVNEAR